MPHLEGREVGGCKLIRKIGAGGMGEVYLGEQIRVGNRSVAVKVVSPDDMTLHPEQADDIARRFEREAAILGNLSHPNILPVHDSGVQDGMLYLVMEYAPDGSLADALRGSGKHKLTLPLSLPFTLDLISQVADALQYTHDHGVVHRDVKPGNVLLRIEPNGHWHALLADYGVARSVEMNSQRTQVSGTFIYMAPEQFSAKFSPASDQYALAVMTFQLLAGRPPFDGDLATLTRAHMYEEPPSLHALNPAVPVAMDAVIKRALAKDPAQRYPAVAAFANALRVASGSDATTEPGTVRVAPATAPMTGATNVATDPNIAPVETPTSRARAQRRSSPWRILAVVLVAVLLVALLIGGEQYLQRNVQPNASATQTAQAQVTQTAQTTATATTGATVTVAATGTVGGGLPPALATCSAPLAITADANCIPTPPVTGTQKLNADAPGCLSQTGFWTTYADTQLNCSSTKGALITATAPNTLGCIEAQSVTVADGYASVFVTKSSGNPVLVFRQGKVGNGAGTGFNSTGYFFEVASGTNQFEYVLYRIDANGAKGIIQNETVSAQLAQHFVLGVSFSGTTFKFYINGNQIGTTATDNNVPPISNGWAGVCVDSGTASSGTASYRSMQVISTGS